MYGRSSTCTVATLQSLWAEMKVTFNQGFPERIKEGNYRQQLQRLGT